MDHFQDKNDPSHFSNYFFLQCSRNFRKKIKHTSKNITKMKKKSAQKSFLESSNFRRRMK